MYTKGHCGVTLLSYAPVGFGLLISGHESAAVAGGGIVLALMMLPDCDHVVPSLEHRGPTHTLLFALLVGAVLGVCTAVAAPDPGTRFGASAFGFAAGTFAIVAHLIADVLTPMGIQPFWPVSRRRYSLEVTSARNRTANDVLLGLGVLVVTTGLYVLGGIA